MVGIILSFLFLIISIYLIFIHYIKLSKKTINNDSIFTSAGIYIFFIIMLLISIILYIFSLYNFQMKNLKSAWLLFSIAAFIQFIAISGLLSYYYEYIINEEEIIINHILLKSRRFKLNKIKYILNYRNYYFYDKYNKNLFSLSKDILGVNNFVTKIKLKANLINYNERDLADNISKVYTNMEAETLINIGKDYRDKYYKRIRNAKLQGVLSFLIYFSVIFLMCVIKSWLYLFFLIFMPIVVLGVFSPLKKGHEKDLRLSNFELGIRNYLKNNKVKGSCKYFLKIVTCWSLAFFSLGFIMSLIFIPISLSSPKSYEDMIYIEGRLQHGYYIEDEYIAISIDDINRQYRLSSIYVKYFDYTFFDDVKIGDKVSLYIEDREHNGKYEGEKIKISYLYYLKANDTVYFNYEDMVNGWIRNNNIGKVSSYVFGGISIASILVIGISYLVYLKKRKSESISIFEITDE